MQCIRHLSELCQIFFYNPPNYSRSHVVYSRSYPDLEGVGLDVQSNEAMAAQLLHEASREGWHPLFPCVCLPFIYLSFLSPADTFHTHYTFQSRSAETTHSRFFSKTRNLLYNISDMIVNGSPTLNSNLMLFLGAFTYLLWCSMMPRFIISVRELYERDPRRRQQGIDSGFGVSSQPDISENQAVSAIAFAEVIPEEGQMAEGQVGESEGIQLEVVGDGARQV